MSMIEEKNLNFDLNEMNTLSEFYQYVLNSSYVIKIIHFIKNHFKS